MHHRVVDRIFSTCMLEPQIPATAHSPNFSRIFGTSTSAFELLVLKRKIMGPCWLQIKNPVIENKGIHWLSISDTHFIQISWHNLEVTVSDPKNINLFLDLDAKALMGILPLTMVSLSIHTIINHQENKWEIVCSTQNLPHGSNNHFYL